MHKCVCIQCLMICQMASKAFDNTCLLVITDGKDFCGEHSDDVHGMVDIFHCCSVTLACSDCCNHINTRKNEEGSEKGMNKSRNSQLNFHWTFF